MTVSAVTRCVLGLEAAGSTQASPTASAPASGAIQYLMCGVRKRKQGYVTRKTPFIPAAA